MLTTKLLKQNIIILSAAATLTLSTGIQAHEREYNQRAIYKQLDLTEQQHQDLREVKKQTKDDTHVYKQDLKQLEQQLKTLIQSERWDAESARALIERRQELKSELALTRALNHNYLWNVLDDSQQHKFTELTARKFDRKDIRQDKDSRHPLKRLNRLDLTEAQQQQISALLEQQKHQQSDIRQAVKAKKQDMLRLVRSTEFDQAQWQVIQQEMKESQVALAMSFSQTRHQIWNLLDEQQQGKMANMKKRQGHGDKKRKHRESV
ncbi:Spy/CpxP family protein refolding chaperone [Aliiglaciecola sp. LCG003]|uniref:Spy/CpxP family protein refolding chaperone n=1 Tax=Aliiglaciecola sp. LCG003 TaxID=3053655 RepID=UPI002572F87F|nr:Spy/CpxP family protein refolding chaperone [Aliiglaciecola sp. LCG003]WJG10027.1 Spy/CpxP family protein refolding chaperone [Aliiglaciecola sp. LCG003]